MHPSFYRLILFCLILSLQISCSEKSAFDEDVKASNLQPAASEDQGPADRSADEGDAQGKSKSDELAEIFTDKANEAAQRCAQGPVVTQVQHIAFPDGNVCDWGQNGNLSVQNRLVRARREQYTSLALPSGAVLCDIGFNFPTTTMVYDDEIFLLLNGLVLTSSQSYHNAQIFPDNHLDMFQEFVAYKWEKYRGAYYDQFFSPQYCLGGAASTCVIPPSEQVGTMRLQIDAALVKKLAVLSGLAFDCDIKAAYGDALPQGISDAPMNSLGFVTTGDDDPSDCKHTAFNFDVTLKYVQ